MAKPLVVDGQPVLGPDKTPIMVPEDITPDEVDIIMGDLAKPLAREATSRTKEFGRSTLQGLENLMAGIDQLATLADIKITEQAAEQQASPQLEEQAQIKTQQLLDDTDEFTAKRAAFRTQQAIRLADSGINPDSPGAIIATMGGELLGEGLVLGPLGGLGRKAITSEATERGLRGIGQRSLGEAAIGATEGAAVFAEDEQERGLNIMLQGGTSGFLGGVFEIIGGARRAFSKGLIKEVVDDGADEVQRSLALAQKAELESAAMLTPGQASGGPKTQQLEAGLQGAIGSPFQRKLRAQQTAALEQYNNILNVVQGGPGIAPNRAAEVIGSALNRTTTELRGLRREAWIGGIKDSLERVGGKIDVETGRILDKGEAVVPTENMQRVLAGWKAELANASSTLLPTERTLIKRSSEALENEITASGGFLSIGTINDWLINTTKVLDAPKFNAVAAEAKDAMLRDLNEVGTNIPGFDNDAALSLLNARARYAVDSDAISKLEKSAVGDIFERFEVDVLSEDLGQQLLTLSPGQIKTSLSEVGGKVGRQYADAIRAEYLRALRNSALIVDQATGRVEGVDPVTLLGLVSRNREQIAQILPPEITRKQSWLDGMGLIERFARGRGSGGTGRSIAGEQAETVLTAGTLMTGADVASLGFAARALFGRFSQSSFETLFMDPNASKLIQKLGSRSISTNRAAQQEIFGNLIRYINQRRVQTEQKKSQQQRRLNQITIDQAKKRAAQQGGP